MDKHRQCRGVAECGFCTGSCPFHAELIAGVRPIKRNHVDHLCDGTGELFYATGEGPEEREEGSLREFHDLMRDPFDGVNDTLNETPVKRLRHSQRGR